MKKYGQVILSIPRVRETTGATILSEIGNINKFSSANKLLAFDGLDLSIYQSGQ